MAPDTEKDILRPGSPTASKTSKESATDATHDLEAGSVKKTRNPLLFWRRRAQPVTSTDHTAEVEVSDEFFTRKLDKAHEGYPQVATFTSSDRDFLQFRSFSYLHTRVLLDLQQDIEILEDELDRLDDFEMTEHGDPRRLKNKKRDDNQGTLDRMDSSAFRLRFERTRPQMLQELRMKLLQYDTALIKTKEVLTLQKPSRKHYESVRDWLLGEQPLVESGLAYIHRREDIITLGTARESAAFDYFVERMVYRFDVFFQKQLGCSVFQRIFLTSVLRAKTANKRFHYYDADRIDAMVNVIITLIIFTLMVLPVVSLFGMSDTGTATPFQAIGVLIVFTLLFGCAMSGLTKATRHELFAASAAYCAVLVVFISNFSTQNVKIEA